MQLSGIQLSGMQLSGIQLSSMQLSGMQIYSRKIFWREIIKWMVKISCTRKSEYSQGVAYLHSILCSDI